MITYKKTLLNLENYLDILRSDGYPLDVIDEVRLAIMDNTPLTERMIRKGKKDGYWLNQVRLLLKEYRSSEFTKIPYPKVIKEVRKVLNEGIREDLIIQSISGEYSEKANMAILDLLNNGYEVKGYNFGIISNESIEAFKWGIKQGLDLTPLNDGIQYSGDYISQCIRIMLKHRSIKPFLGGEWDSDIISILATIEEDKEYIDVLSYITSNTTKGMVWEIIDCVKHCPEILDEVSKVDRDSGMHIYSPMQVNIIKKACEQGLEWRDLLDPNLDANQLYDILNSVGVLKQS